MNKSVLFSLVILVFVGVCVSRVKYEVVFLRDKLAAINKEIEKCSDDIKVFEAEWSYLNDPKRLKKLCNKYLQDMRPMENSQMVSYKELCGTEFESVKKDKNALGSFLDDALKSEFVEAG